ncbi:MAG: hypothetical protein U0166_19650 [Acidobacteriota bacterium]
MDNVDRDEAADIVRREVQRIFGETLGLQPSNTSTSSGLENDMPEALVCEPDAAVARALDGALRSLGYQIDVQTGLQESFQALDQAYDLVVVGHAFAEDPEGGKTLLRKLAGGSPERRRHTFVAFVSPKYKSLDGLPAFVLGADIVISSADVGRAMELLREGIRGKAQLYRVFERCQRG